MESIGPGDIVESLIDWDVSTDRLIKGAVYCVSQVFPRRITWECLSHGPSCDSFGVGLTTDAKAATAYDCWCAASFKPIKRRDEKLLQSLLHPTEEPIRQEILDWVTRHG